MQKLTRLRLPGFREGLEQQWQSPKYSELSFEERLGMLVDLECTRRDDSSLRQRVRAARLALPASIEDLNLSPARGLDRSFILELVQGEWIRRHLNVLIVGATGVGKSYLACALAQAACRHGHSVRYFRTSRLLHDFVLSHADGSFAKVLGSLARVKLLILDDWLRDPLTVTQARDLLEIIDDRYGRASTLLSTQIPVQDWHAHLPDPTLADALLDRLVHNAYTLELKGGSMRKAYSPLADDHR
jgi:DNA replication protein DnaC